MLRKAVLAFEGLAETYFYLGDGLRTLSAAMSTLNLSERAWTLSRACPGLRDSVGHCGAVSS